MSNWHTATLIKNQKVASNVYGLTFDVPTWPGHNPGQHCDIRLTAPDGYYAERKYSLGSPPETKTQLEFGIQLIEGGEVSPYLASLTAGSQVQLRGPLGGYFQWNVTQPGPLLLIGGGSGMVPLMSMIRHRAYYQDARDVVFLISARSFDKVLYAAELQTLAERDSRLKIYITLTNEWPTEWKGYMRRLDVPMLQETMGTLLGSDAAAYICGPTPFVEAAANDLVQVGLPVGNIRTERFGGA